MGKKADNYFLTDPWKIVEKGFREPYSKVAESVFSLGNEFMGIRGFFEENYTGETLRGSYFNGVYESRKLDNGGYKGVIHETEFMVNAVNWLAVDICFEGEHLNLAVSNYRDFERELDMRTGLLTRKFVWITKSGKELEMVFERIISMEQENAGAQRITVSPLGADGELVLSEELDFGSIHEMYQKNFWNCTGHEEKENWLFMEAETEHTKQYLCSGNRFLVQGNAEEQTFSEKKKNGIHYRLKLKSGQKTVISRIAWNSREKVPDIDKRLENITFESILRGNERWWEKVWRSSDIRIDGDVQNQQGIRFCIFQLFQTYHGAGESNNIGAKGLTGEAYNGNAFWDTETYCLPFFLFNNMEAAKSLLMFRYRTLPQAKERAKELDCKGAFYPIATIGGKECCSLWQHASLQLQASTGVAYGIWAYEKMSGDRKFLYENGLEMLIEICRMLATRGAWSADGKKYGFYCVMGPDEFQMMVNHNCYTNVMGRFTFEYTLKTIEDFEKRDPENYEKVTEKLHISEEELCGWRKMARRMYIPYDSTRQLFEQNEGFFSMPHVDVDAIPTEEFPLYDHWSYDRIYRNDMIKQPDVLMLLLMFNTSFTERQIRENYEFYEPKCIHESSLSPSVHSILASQLKKKKEAYEFFRFATRMDLDNYNRNSGDGLHTTSIAAAWMNIIYGFGGMRSDGKNLEFNPTIPADWNGYEFRITAQKKVLCVSVEKEDVKIKLLEQGQLTAKVYGKKYIITEAEIEIPIPGEWR